MTRKELELKIRLIDLLVAINKYIVDWRDYEHLFYAVTGADVILDLWAGDDLNARKRDWEEQLNNLQNDQ